MPTKLLRWNDTEWIQFTSISELKIGPNYVIVLEQEMQTGQAIRIRNKPIEVTAIQWTNNEPFIREFVQNDDNLRFRDGGTIEVWNEEEQSWINCPMFHYIVKGIKGEFYPVSPEVFQRSYEVIE